MRNLLVEFLNQEKQLSSWCFGHWQAECCSSLFSSFRKPIHNSQYIREIPWFRFCNQIFIVLSVTVEHGLHFFFDVHSRDRECKKRKENWIGFSIRSLSKIANRTFIQFFIHHQRPSTVIRRHEMLHEAPVLPNEDPEDGDALFLWTAKRFQLTDHLREICRFFCFSYFYPFSILPKCSLREWCPALS